MAIRFDALTDAAQVSVAGLSGGAFTLTGWVVLATDLNTYTGIASLESAGGPAVTLSTKVDGTTFTAWDNAGTETGALGTISATVGVVTPVWYRFAVVQNAGTQSLYIGTAVGALTKGSKVQTNNTTPDKIVLGSTMFGDYFNGRLASVKFYVGALSDDEVALELSQYRPVRSDGLIAWYPLISDLKDYSGNGRDLTAGSTATAVEDGPALRWDSRLQPRIMRSTATGGPGAVTGAAAAPLGGLTATASGTAWRNVSTLTDSFDDGSINSTKWPFTFGPGAVAETGGKMTVGAVVAGDLTGIFSDNHYSFAGNTVSIQMVPPALNGAAWAYCALTLYHAGYASWARVYIERDAGTPETFRFGFTLKESSTTTRSTFVAASLADVAWVRLREAGGTTYAEMSTTGAPGSWVTTDSFATPPSLLASRQVEVDLEAQRTTGASSAAGPATFDNLNLPGHTGDILDIGATDLNHFSLQYAVNGAGSPSTATQADIAAGFAVDPYFYPTTDGQRVQLWARLDGPTTGGASFSRAELREVKADGSDAAWDATAGSHELRVKVTPTHLPAVTPAVVFAQMYDNVATADRISIRTQLVSGTARLRIRINGSTVALDATSPINPGSNDLAVGVGNIVGIEWDFKIALSGGAIAIYVNNMTTPVLTRPAGTLANNGAANYWKTGCYNQASTATGDSGTDWGSVELRGLAVSHAVPGTASATLGGLAATATGTRKLPASAAATLGGLTASATATRRTSAAAAAPFGRLTAAAAGTVRHPATATAPLGRLVSSASANVRRAATVSAPLGALTATASATIRHPAVASASFGGLVATATATRRAAAVATAPLGSLAATAQAAVRVPATATATLGALVATTTANVRVPAAAAAPLAGLTAAATGIVTGQTGGSATAPLGPLTAIANGRVTHSATASAPLGGLAAAASAGVRHPASGAAALGGLSAAASARVGVPAAAATQLGRLTGIGAATINRPGSAAAALGRLVATAAATITHVGTTAAALGGLTGGATAHSSRSGVAAAPLGGLTAAAVARVAVPAAAHTTLGSLAAAANGRGDVAAAAAAMFGGLTSAADGTSTGDGSGAASADLGTLAATAAGRRNVTAVAASNLAGLTARADAVRLVAGTAVADLGALHVLASAESAVVAVALADLGGLDAGAMATLERVGAAIADLGELAGSAAAVSTGEAAAVAEIGRLVAAAVGVVTPPTTWTPPLHAGPPVRLTHPLHAGNPAAGTHSLHAGPPTRD